MTCFFHAARAAAAFVLVGIAVVPAARGTDGEDPVSVDRCAPRLVSSTPEPSHVVDGYQQAVDLLRQIGIPEWAKNEAVTWRGPDGAPVEFQPGSGLLPPIGISVTLEREMRAEMILLAAFATGDFNRFHVDAQAAREAGFPDVVAHGVLVIGVVSKVIGTFLPGDGSIFRALEAKFSKPTFPGETLLVTVTVADVKDRARTVTLDVDVRKKSNNQPVVRGSATVIVP